MLEIKKLKKKFWTQTKKKTVLNQISLKVKPGSVFGFLGLNGAGKSTTVKIIGSLLFADSGRVTISGLPHDQPEAKKLLGFMPENPQFHTHLTAREVLRYVGELFEIDRPTLENRIPKILAEVGLKDAIDQSARTFSKGMTQRLGFGVALVNEPKLLVLDEPLDGLDPLGRLDFKRLIGRLRKQGTTVFFSTHILSDVQEICDEVAIINSGEIILQGSPKTLLGNRPQTLEELFVETVKK